MFKSIFADYGFISDVSIKHLNPSYCNSLHRIAIILCNEDINFSDNEKEYKDLGYKVYFLKIDKLYNKNLISFLDSLNIKSNLQEKYKGKTTEEIVDILSKDRLPFAACMSHWKGDFNFSTLCRNANAFGAKEIFYFGKKQWIKKGAVGCYHYTSVNYLSCYDELIKLKEKYIFIGVDNIEGSVSIENFVYPKNSLFIFGEENSGLQKETIELCDFIIEIPMMGTVRSLNAGTSSGIILYDYFIKNKLSK